MEAAEGKELIIFVLTSTTETKVNEIPNVILVNGVFYGLNACVVDYFDGDRVKYAAHLFSFDKVQPNLKRSVIFTNR
jgi:hypothetical protein